MTSIDDTHWRSADLIGSGWAFPAEITPGGSVRLVGGGDEVDAALRMILGTAPGERVMRPEFGCAMWQHVFDPVNSSTLGLIEQNVREAVLRWEPRVELSEVSTRPAGDGSMIEIVIRYVVRATNDHRNLVYPFYTIPAEESGA